MEVKINLFQLCAHKPPSPLGVQLQDGRPVLVFPPNDGERVKGSPYLEEHVRGGQGRAWPRRSRPRPGKGPCIFPGHLSRDGEPGVAVARGERDAHNNVSAVPQPEPACGPRRSVHEAAKRIIPRGRRAKGDQPGPQVRVMGGGERRLHGRGAGTGKEGALVRRWDWSK